MATVNDTLRQMIRQVDSLPEICPKCGLAVRPTLIGVDRSLIRDGKADTLAIDLLVKHQRGCVKEAA